MRIRGKRLIAVLALAWLCGGAQPAAAEPLAFTGTLTLQLFADPDGTVVIPGSGIAQVTGAPHLSSFLLPAGAFGPVTTLIDLMNATGTSLELVGVENLAGSFVGGTGTMGLSGLARLCLVFAPCEFANVPLLVAATGTPLMGLGIGGTQFTTGAINMTAQHGAWAPTAPGMTIHYPSSTVVTSTFPAGFIHGPASGSASSAAQPSGALQLVTASKAFTSLTGASPEYSMYAVLNLHFVPEPGTLLLLGMAAVGVLAVARSRS